MNDIDLSHLWVVYPGQETYPVTSKITVLPLSSVEETVKSRFVQSEKNNWKDNLKRLLVTGASGFLGWNIIQTAMDQWEVYGTYLNHAVTVSGAKLFRTDLTRYQDLKQTFLHIMPDAVIHAAAVSETNVCGQHPHQPRTINTDASRDSSRANAMGFCPGSIKEELRFLNTRLVE